MAVNSNPNFIYIALFIHQFIINDVPEEAAKVNYGVDLGWIQRALDGVQIQSTRDALQKKLREGGCREEGLALTAGTAVLCNSKVKADKDKVHGWN